jgi:tetratricopeptide (TPR) repeat protein
MRLRSAPLYALILGALTLAGTAGAETAPSYQDLFQQGFAAYQSEDWPRCADRFAAAAKAATSDRQAARAYFASAACLTAAGNKDAAFESLDKAAGKGYRDLERAQGNPQFEPLRQDPRWKTFFEGVQKRHEAYRAKANAELARLYEEDQKDRMTQPIDWSVVGKRDDERLKRTKEIADAGGLREAEDYYHAAMILQHSSKVEDYDRAHQWCLKAVELDPEHPSARWLAAATKDRSLMNQGKPQLYGTQFKKVDGKWILWEVDPSITDEERVKWGVPPLAESKKRAEEMNKESQPN